MENYEKHINEIFDEKYRINRVVGVGGMAVVYEATELATGKLVALKMLKESISDNTQALRRFINESRAVSMLNHPNIVKILDFSFKTKYKFLVMEYIQGITLRDYMNKKVKLSWQTATAFIAQILQALDHAHMKGVIHRDIKPQNIMVMEGGFIKVADFGIAKIPNAETVTMGDHAVGTIYYISPEQAKGKKIDARSDLYSLGVMFYEMITGELPFMAENSYSIMHKHIYDPPTPPSKLIPQLPYGVEQIILFAMEKMANNRYQSAAQMHRHILRIQQDPTAILTPPSRTPTSELAIKKTAETANKFKEEEKKTSEPQKKTPTDTRHTYSEYKHPSKDKTAAKKTASHDSVPFSVVIVICVAFLLLAAIGLFVICEVLYPEKFSNMGSFAVHFFGRCLSLIRTGMKCL